MLFDQIVRSMLCGKEIGRHSVSYSFFVCFLTTKLITVVNYRYLSRRVSETNWCHSIELCEGSFNFLFQENTFYSKEKERIPDPTTHSQSCCFPYPYQHYVCREVEGHVSIHSHTNNHYDFDFLFHIFPQASNLTAVRCLNAKLICNKAPILPSGKVGWSKGVSSPLLSLWLLLKMFSVEQSTW